MKTILLPVVLMGSIFCTNLAEEYPNLSEDFVSSFDDKKLRSGKYLSAGIGTFIYSNSGFFADDLDNRFYSPFSVSIKGGAISHIGDHMAVRGYLCFDLGRGVVPTSVSENDLRYVSFFGAGIDIMLDVFPDYCSDYCLSLFAGLGAGGLFYTAGSRVYITFGSSVQFGLSQAITKYHRLELHLRFLPSVFDGDISMSPDYSPFISYVYKL